MNYGIEYFSVSLDNYNKSDINENTNFFFNFLHYKSCRRIALNRALVFLNLNRLPDNHHFTCQLYFLNRTSPYGNLMHGHKCFAFLLEINYQNLLIDRKPAWNNKNRWGTTSRAARNELSVWDYYACLWWIDIAKKFAVRRRSPRWLRLWKAKFPFSRMKRRDFSNKKANWKLTSCNDAHKRFQWVNVE
jgi:hypothetical protein